jgi:hypothetical protein
VLHRCLTFDIDRTLPLCVPFVPNRSGLQATGDR